MNDSCAISTEKINMKQLIEILPKEMIIVYIEKGSTFLTIAFILTEEFEDEKKYQEIVQSIQSELTSLNGKSIVGNLLAEPVIHCPTDEDIKKFYTNLSKLNAFRKIVKTNKTHHISRQIYVTVSRQIQFTISRIQILALIFWTKLYARL